METLGAAEKRRSVCLSDADVILIIQLVAILDLHSQAKDSAAWLDAMQDCRGPLHLQCNEMQTRGPVSRGFAVPRVKTSLTDNLLIYQ